MIKTACFICKQMVIILSFLLVCSNKAKLPMFLYFAFNLSDILNLLNTISTSQYCFAIHYVKFTIQFNVSLSMTNSFSKYFLST